MEVVIKDEQGLGALLLEQGYSQTQIERAKQTVQKLYENAAQRVAEKGLHPKLASAIKQLPVNIAFVRRYLTLIP